ncbi:MAG: response regulator [Corticimicrobacter sp.]|uniref:response regulator n=1 Tax=Corticimicrobacter sp. TaxID=2678536 RepID=UPI0032D9CC39
MRALRILVVDDDVLNLRIAARLLKELGHAGALASDGDKALRLLVEQSFDVMLLDVNMPHPCGDATLRALRARERTAGGKRLPVLMISGYVTEETRHHFMEMGANGFIEKPLALDVLATELAQLIPG